MMNTLPGFHAAQPQFSAKKKPAAPAASVPPTDIRGLYRQREAATNKLTGLLRDKGIPKAFGFTLPTIAEIMLFYGFERNSNQPQLYIDTLKTIPGFSVTGTGSDTKYQYKDPEQGANAPSFPIEFKMRDPRR